MPTFKYNRDEDEKIKILFWKDPEDEENKVSCQCCCGFFKAFEPESNGLYKYYRKAKINFTANYTSSSLLDCCTPTGYSDTTDGSLNYEIGYVFGVPPNSEDPNQNPVCFLKCFSAEGSITSEWTCQGSFCYCAGGTQVTNVSNCITNSIYTPLVEDDQFFYCPPYDAETPFAPPHTPIVNPQPSAYLQIISKTKYTLDTALPSDSYTIPCPQGEDVCSFIENESYTFSGVSRYTVELEDEI